MKKWREENGVIYFSVTSNGTTGKGWIRRFIIKGIGCSKYAKKILLSSYFKPTSGVATQVAVLKGTLSREDFRYNAKQEASRRGFAKPTAEIGCLIRDKFSDKEIRAMGLNYIIVLHDTFSMHIFIGGLTCPVLRIDASVNRLFRFKRLFLRQSLEDTELNCPYSGVRGIGLAYIVSSTKKGPNNLGALVRWILARLKLKLIRGKR